METMHPKPFANRLRTFASLSLADHLALVGMTCRLLGARAALTALPYATVRRYFARPHRRPLQVADGVAYRRRVAWAVRAAGRWVLGDRPCLAQALVTERLLRRGGVPAHLRIGVAKAPDGRLLAHAWVESEGYVVVGSRTSPARYRELQPLAGVAPKAQSERAETLDGSPASSLR